MSKEEQICRRSIKRALTDGEITLSEAMFEFERLNRVFGRPSPSTENEMRLKEKRDGDLPTSTQEA